MTSESCFVDHKGQRAGSVLMAQRFYSMTTINHKTYRYVYSQCRLPERTGPVIPTCKRGYIHRASQPARCVCACKRARPQCLYYLHCDPSRPDLSKGRCGERWRGRWLDIVSDLLPSGPLSRPQLSAACMRVFPRCTWTNGHACYILLYISH